MIRPLKMAPLFLFIYPLLDQPLPQPVIILILTPKQLHLLVYQRETSALINRRGCEGPSSAGFPGN